MEVHYTAKAADTSATDRLVSVALVKEVHLLLCKFQESWRQRHLLTNTQDLPVCLLPESVQRIKQLERERESRESRSRVQGYAPLPYAYPLTRLQ